MDEERSVHTMRNDGRHTSSLECQCNPVAHKRCPEECANGCWACERGWVRINLLEAILSDEPLHIIHNDL